MASIVTESVLTPWNRGDQPRAKRYVSYLNKSFAALLGQRAMSSPNPDHCFTATYDGADEGTDQGVVEKASNILACRIARKFQMCAMIALRERN